MDGKGLSAFFVFSPIFICSGAIACCFACITFSLSPERVSESERMHDHTANYGAMGPQVVPDSHPSNHS
eukprot:4366017-Amphidinium_carterae.1